MQQKELMLIMCPVMGNPFVVALVVFPAASSKSVTSLTFADILLISAIPPALSVIGPYASKAIIIPVRITLLLQLMLHHIILLNYETPIAITIKIAGNAVLFNPKANPLIKFVPAPVFDASTNSFYWLVFCIRIIFCKANQYCC